LSTTAFFQATKKKWNFSLNNFNIDLVAIRPSRERLILEKGEVSPPRKNVQGSHALKIENIKRLIVYMVHYLQNVVPIHYIYYFI